MTQSSSRLLPDGSTFPPVTPDPPPPPGYVDPLLSLELDAGAAVGDAEGQDETQARDTEA
jgi:hypothetical protein